MKNTQSKLICQKHLERIKDDAENQIEAFILKEAATFMYQDFLEKPLKEGPVTRSGKKKT